MKIETLPEIFAYFQPIVDVNSLSIIGYEATTRGRIRETGEEFSFNELKCKFNLNILDFKSRDVSIHEFNKKFRETDFLLFLNFTTTNIEDSHLFQRDRELNKIVLEFTEHNELEFSPRSKEILEKYKKDGLNIALDDFGIGYTNLDQIIELRPKYIKLDKKFMATLSDPEKHEETKRLISAFCVFCKSLGIEIILEGIEPGHEMYLPLLMSCGIYLYQGYLFGYPKPLGEIHMEQQKEEIRYVIERSSKQALLRKLS